MHEIHVYRDKNGKEPVTEYLRLLSKNNCKDNRIKLKKINDYIELLSKYGTSLGEPYIKYIEDGIWELRPLRDRILFVTWINDSYVLLHQFMKKTQKTPRKEIEKAKRELKDIQERGILNEQ
ncbi:type II toxin-antitoxin system RelE/ParE family toxin [Granulicatella sp.]